MVDVARLEAKTARLREQATKLHEADAAAGAAAYRKVGQQKDEANQHLRAAHEAAKAAEAQAKEQHARAQDFEQQARNLEEGAKDEFNKVARISEQDLEQAQKLRAIAAAASERAAENHRAVARHQAEVQRFEREIDGLQAQLDLGNTPVERLADQIDDMVDRGAHAAKYLREAERLDAAGDTEAAAVMRGLANDELTLLEQIRPDYASVDPAVLTSAGITAADQDLLDPTLVPDDAPSTLPELMDPSDPTSDASDVLGSDDVRVASAETTDDSAADGETGTETATTEGPWVAAATADPAPPPPSEADVLQADPVVASFDASESTGFEEPTDEGWGGDEVTDETWGAGHSDG